MPSMPFQKYRPWSVPALPDRRWPDRRIERAPRWCAVDLRDGNQALVEPMGQARKLRMFQQLLALGFREIEVGFPAASQPDFDFVRHLIEAELIPEGVTIQVCTQTRDALIDRSFEAIAGARRAIVHIYNSTSTLQREVVFGMDRAEVIDLALRGVRRVQARAAELPDTEVVLQYSPESFTGTELDFARDISDAVADLWRPTPEAPMILNLPSTVEMTTPNGYADQIEWMDRNLHCRDSVVLSVHPHNDRGTAVAATELAVMAGADRVEGTLFGNGERTGNVDLVTLALNLMTQGVDPELYISDIDRLVATAEHCNRLPVHPRHPYAGKLVFTAFSGSHQHAIKKGLAAQEARRDGRWEVPYLPVDPADLGRSYEAVIRINSQSGKSGVAYLMEADHSYRLPRALAIELSQAVQQLSEQTEGEVDSSGVREVFEAGYLRGGEGLVQLDLRRAPGIVEATLRVRDPDTGVEVLVGRGSGPVEASLKAAVPGLDLEVSDFSQHALEQGVSARSVAYLRVRGTDGREAWGAGVSEDVTEASVRAVLSAVSRLAVPARMAAE